MPSSITLTVSNLPTSTSFFLSVLQPLNYIYRGRVGNTIGFGLPDTPPDFWISQESPGVPSGAAHVAFPAVSKQAVQDFFVAAVKAGGRCHSERGEPMLRDLATGYFSAAIIDFDGNSIEAVHRPDLVDEGYGSRPSSVSSVTSVNARPSKASKAAGMVSKASTARSPPTEVGSIAPSQASKASTKPRTQVSRAPSSASKAPSIAPSHTSRAPSQVSRASTSISRSESSTSRQQQQAEPLQIPITHATPTGDIVTTLVTQARGAYDVAQNLISHVRPALDSSNSAPNVSTTKSKSSNSNSTPDPTSHKPSDTIVGTLLGVAAGAALHYAYTRATENSEKSSQPPQPASYRPAIARTNTEPSFASGVDEQRRYYYHEYARTPANHPYAIEAPRSEYEGAQWRGSGYEGGDSRVGGRGGEQRYITMEDHDERMSDFTRGARSVVSGSAATVKPRARRRSSFSGVDVRSLVSGNGAGSGTCTLTRASQTPKTPSRMLEAPPTSYRAPTAITTVTAADADAETDNGSRAGGRSRSKSRLSSMMRASSVSGGSKASASNSGSGRRGGSRHDTGSDGEKDLRSSARSHASRRSNTSKHGGDKTSRVPSRSRAGSIAASDHSSASTVVPISKKPPGSSAPSKAGSRAQSRTSTIDPSARPLPPSRANSSVSATASDYHSTHSKANHTVIGRMLERDRGGAQLTKSVVGKIQDVRGLNVDSGEVRPGDSVSQVSSRRGSRR